MPPRGSSAVAYWPMFFIKRGSNNDFFDPFGQRIIWSIKHPIDINWETELRFVEQTLKELTLRTNTNCSILGNWK